MHEDTTKLTIRLPRESVDFAKAYARAHGITVTEFIERYLARMRAEASEDLSALSPQLRAIHGILPADIDVEAQWHDHLERKHR